MRDLDAWVRRDPHHRHCWCSTARSARARRARVVRRGRRRPTSLLLGASMTKSALAHLVGQRRSRGRAAPRGPGRPSTCPSSPGRGYAGVHRRAPADHDHRHRLGRGPPRPDRPGHAAGRLLRRRRRRLARPAGRGRADGPARARAGSTTPPTRRCSTGCASGPPARPTPRRWPSCGATLGCVRDAVVGVDAEGVALAGGGLAACAEDWAAAGGAAARPARRTTHGCSAPDWVRALLDARRRRSLEPGRLPSSITTHAGFGYHWWPLTDDGRPRDRRRQPRPVRLRRPRPRRRRAQDLAVALRRLARRPAAARPVLPRTARRRSRGAGRSTTRNDNRR